jgi:hypothetical protein
VEDVLEVREGLRVSEDLAAERAAVDAPLAKDIFPETFDDLGYGLQVFGEEVVDDLVGRDGLGAELA